MRRDALRDQVDRNLLNLLAGKDYDPNQLRDPHTGEWVSFLIPDVGNLDAPTTDQLLASVGDVPDVHIETESSPRWQLLTAGPVKDPVHGTSISKAARLIYSVEGDTVSVTMVWTDEAVRGRGYARALLAEMAKRHPGHKIRWDRLLPGGEHLVEMLRGGTASDVLAVLAKDYP